MTDSFDSPDGRTCSTPETAGQAAYEAFAKAIPEDVFPEHLRDMGWTDWRDLRDHERPAWEAAAQAAIAAAAPAPAGEGEVDLASNEMRPGELDATLATVPPCDAISSWGMRCRVVRAHETHRDRDGNMWPQPASELAEAVTVEGVLCRDYPAVVAAMQAAGDRRQVLILRLIDERDLARAETAAIRAAAANTARELAEAREQRDGLRYGIERAITHLEESAAATSPSKKSAIEVAVAGRLRALLDQP